jgi:hypothetical protein
VVLAVSGGISAKGRLVPGSQAFAASALPQVNFFGANTYTAPTNLNTPLTQRVYLKRETNCHLTSTTINSASPNKVVATVQNFEDVLHKAAQLDSTADVFPGGCPQYFPGESGQFGGAVGRTANGDYFVAIINEGNTGGVNVFVSNGSTSSKPVVNYPTGGTGASPFVLGIADLGNGEGDIVVLSFTNSGAVVSVLLGKGDGTFQQSVDYPLTISLGNMAIADVNNDGVPDVVAVGNGAVQVLIGKGDGTFSIQTAIPSAINAGGVVIAKFNTKNDTHMDLATSDGHILLGDGHGNFTAMAGTQFPTGNGSISSLATADFNNDGKADLAITNPDTNVTSIFLGNGDGTFTPGSNYAAIYGAFETGTADLDGDGNPDIITAMVSPDLYGPDIDTLGFGYYLMGRGDGTFAGVPAYVAPTGDNWKPGLAAGDFNGNKTPDLLINGIQTSDLSSFLQVLTGDGHGAFTPGPKSPIPATGLLAAGLADPGSSDLAAFIASSSSSTSGNLLVAFGNGDGTFKTPDQYPFASAATVLALGNFNAKTNGANNVDVVVGGVSSHDGLGNPTTGALFLFSNDGHGNYSSAKIATPLNPVSIAAVDVNKDGFTDLVVSDNGSPFSTPAVPGSVMVYLGKGDGTFEAPKPLSGIGTSPGPLAVDEVSGDGNKDVVVSSTNLTTFNTSILLAKGNGDGTFKTPTSLGDDFGVTGIGIGDFNGDGHPDLLVTACCGATQSEVLLGKGDGTFPQTQVLPVANSESAVLVGDLNGDNHADAIVEYGDPVTSATLEVLLNGLSPVVLPNPVLTPKATTVAFGDVFATGASAAKTATLTNKSTVAAVVGQATVPEGVIVKKDTCSNKTIKAKASCSVSMVYSPAIPGALSGSLAVPYGASSATETLSAEVTLTGTGEAVTLTPPVLEKFAVTKAGTLKTATVTIKNKTTVPVTMGTLALSGDSSFTTILDKCSTKIVKAKASCTDKLQFAPPLGTASGTILTGTLTAPFTYGANIGSPAAIPIEGPVK